MLACQRSIRTLATNSNRKIHTMPALLAENEGGLFGKFNPWANKTNKKEEQVTPAVSTSTDIATKVTFNVKYQDAEDIVSWKNTELLQDPVEIESKVKSVILQHLQSANETNWNSLPLENIEDKFKILKESMKDTGKEVPNYELNAIKSTSDVLTYFKHGGQLTAEEKSVSTYFEEKADELPKNLTFIN